ncbi:MAG: preprotein translocase subunit YajC [Bacteroidetes bacterium]|nr:preprotein translocase subunit YajC [Bacteroidota bacterium]
MDLAVPMVLVIVVFYLFIMLPQMRKQKKAKQYFNELKKGDKIITTGGIHGKIITVNEKNFVVETEEGKLKIEKAAVSMDMTAAEYKNQSAESEKA